MVVYGSTVLDYIAVAERLPEKNETVVTAEVEIQPGGKGANQALAARRFGSEVVFISYVGRDDWGEKALSNLNEYGVDVSDVVLSEKRTSIGLLQSSTEGDCQIVVGLGSAQEASESDVTDDHLRNSGVLLAQLELNPAETFKLIRRAAQYECTVILNFAPGAQCSRRDLQYCDYIIANETEADYLFECIGTGRSELIESVQETAAALATNVIVTLGQAGGMAFLNGQIFKIPTKPTDPVEPAGAGDAYCGTFAAAIEEGMTATGALRLASAAGSFACLQVGAQTANLSRQDVFSIASNIKPPISQIT